MGVDGSNFNTGEWGLQEPLKVAGKGDGVCELLEPQEQGHDMHFKVPLSYVIEDHVSNPGAIVVCDFLPGIIVLIECILSSCCQQRERKVMRSSCINMLSLLLQAMY